jgi:hypothetical protein
MSDVNRIAQIEMFDQRSDIGRVVIHIVAVAYLARSTVTASIMGDDAEAFADEVQHLVIPVI